MDYIIGSTAVTDEICFADGKTVEKVAGGAGIYALCGIKLWHDNVGIVTGVGKDYEEIYGDWYRKNQITMQGLLIKDEKTPHTVIQYFEDGEREETPRYGDLHYKKIEVTPKELAPYLKKAKGMYLFKNTDASFWQEFLELKKESHTKVMWEIGCDATYLENKKIVEKIAKQLDILSINFTEAKSLLGLDSLDLVIEELKSWGLPLIFLRRGSKGAIMITDQEIVEVPSCKNVQVVDPTGGGNSSSGAVLYGFCEGMELYTCGMMGSIAAAMCLEQYGVPKIINLKTREEAQKKLSQKRC